MPLIENTPIFIMDIVYNKANMEIKKDIANDEIVVWDPKYAVGIKLIDDQHRELVNLTNQLFAACKVRSDSINTVFSETMKKMVEYVRFHFTAENSLLEHVRYPDIAEHKNQHDVLIKEILASVKNFNEGNKFVPNTFVRTLKEWIFGHIMVSDKAYSRYILEQKKNGLLKDV